MNDQAVIKQLKSRIKQLQTENEELFAKNYFDQREYQLEIREAIKQACEQIQTKVQDAANSSNSISLDYMNKIIEEVQREF